MASENENIARRGLDAEASGTPCPSAEVPSSWLPAGPYLRGGQGNRDDEIGPRSAIFTWAMVGIFGLLGLALLLGAIR